MKLSTQIIRPTVHTSVLRITRSAAIAAAVVLASLGLSASPASADGPVAQPPPSPLTIDEQLRATDKDQVASQYAEHRRSGGTLTGFSPSVAALELRLNGGAAIIGGVTSAGPNRSPQASPDAASESVYTYPAYQIQEHDYHCGPANAWIAMQWKALGNSYRGEAITQDNVGLPFWLNTLDPAGTGFGSNWTKTLNAWTDGTEDGWYVRLGSPSAAQVTNDGSLDLDFNWLPIFDIYMNQSRGFLPGYAGKYSDVWHYVTEMGYSQYGAAVHYVDTFSNGSPGYNYNIGASTFASLMSGYGMIW